jgi:N utilization substance protein A
MQEMGGGPTTPIEQIVELGEAIQTKLISAGITTVEELADMTPEQLEEIPGIGEKTLEKISTAVRHYFGQYEEGEERPAVVAVVSAVESDSEATDGVVDELLAEKTPEAILAAEAGSGEEATPVRDASSETIADAEEAASISDAASEADARQERIEAENDAVDTLVDESQEVSDEGIEPEAPGRG